MILALKNGTVANIWYSMDCNERYKWILFTKTYIYITSTDTSEEHRIKVIVNAAQFLRNMQIVLYIMVAFKLALTNMSISIHYVNYNKYPQISVWIFLKRRNFHDTFTCIVFNNGKLCIALNTYIYITLEISIQSLHSWMNIPMYDILFTYKDLAYMYM